MSHTMFVAKSSETPQIFRGLRAVATTLLFAREMYRIRCWPMNPDAPVTSVSNWGMLPIESWEIFKVSLK